MSKWTFESDEEGVCGQPCEQWLVRDTETDNHDVVCVIPKTGDEDYDNEVTFSRVVKIAALPELLDAAVAALGWLQGRTEAADEYQQLLAAVHECLPH